MEPRTPTDRLEIPPPPPLDMRWRRGLRSMRALIAHPDDTEKAIDFFYAVGRREFERSFQRFVRSPRGRTLLRERPSLADVLNDREALARMPSGSFGRAYLGFLERNGFQATVLIALQRRVEARWAVEEGIPPLDAHRRYFRERLLISHDLFHVLTGYGTDDVGEATLLAFTLAQNPGWGQLVLSAGAALEVSRHLGWRWLLYDLRAWRRGRRAAHLAATPWEEILPLRLDSARSLLGVAPAQDAHPGGILSARLSAA